MTTHNTLLITVDSLREDHYRYMPNTKEFLGDSIPQAFATSTATAGSFQSIIGGYYPDGAGLIADKSIVPRIPNKHRVGVTTNHLLSERYNYNTGFDYFTAPSPDEEGIKGVVQRTLTPGSVPHTMAVAGYNAYQKVRSVLSSGTTAREYRPAADVIDEFQRAVDGKDDWFVWLHFMEPHHPYNPRNGPVDRVTAQAVSRRVLAGKGSQHDEELARELYRTEIEELDQELNRLWKFIDDETRIVFCADHGECLGERDTWGHPGELRMETLHVPLVTRNTPETGDLVSLADIPSLLLGEQHEEGTFDRDVAFATYGDRKAAINETHIRTHAGTFTHNGEAVEESSLDRDYARFSPDGFVKEDARLEDLEALGYV